MIRGSFLARRVKYSRLLLATVMLTVLATVALGAALASFAAQSLPQAVRAAAWRPGPAARRRAAGRGAAGRARLRR